MEIADRDYLSYSNNSMEKEPVWEQKRCPHCDALLFEKDKNLYTLKSVRIKCRLCKEIMVL